jgi:2-haloacid dehalogenase
MDRRLFLRNATIAAGLAVATGTGAQAGTGAEAGTNARIRRRIKAVAFDGFPIIDSRPIASKAEELFPGQGDALITSWRARQFEYTWLRTLSGQYLDFWHTTEDALTFAAESLGVRLDRDSRERLMGVYLELKSWPDARPALESLHAAGIRLAFLSNFTTQMLDAALSNSGLQSLFEPHLSTDRVRAYKPHPKAYGMALQAFSAARDEIVFCASAGWDAAGAKWFGYPTFWVNRSGQPVEQLGVRPDGMGSSLADLVKFVVGI